MFTTIDDYTKKTNLFFPSGCTFYLFYNIILYFEIRNRNIYRLHRVVFRSILFHLYTRRKLYLSASRQRFVGTCLSEISNALFILYIINTTYPTGICFYYFFKYSSTTRYFITLCCREDDIVIIVTYNIHSTMKPKNKIFTIFTIRTLQYFKTGFSGEMKLFEI